MSMRIRRLKEALSSSIMLMAAAFAGSLAVIVLFSLYLRSKPILDTKPLSELLLGITWLPSKGDFGLYPAIISTLYVTLIAMVIAVPLSILSAIYLAEYAKEGLRRRVLPLVDLLAGIPPVVYGVWGVLTIVPFVTYIGPIIGRLGIPFLSSETYLTGFSLLAGGIVLAIMMFPIIISITVQVFRSVPFEVREASLSMGATRWQTVKHVLMRVTLPGIAAAIILGFSRALGETMAVLMVVGNMFMVPTSVFDPAYPLPALIANNYGEMMSIPLYDSALLLAALILMRIERRMLVG
jgi:phosphate transport system permease protein